MLLLLPGTFRSECALAALVAVGHAVAIGVAVVAVGDAVAIVVAMARVPVAFAARLLTRIVAARRIALLYAAGRGQGHQTGGQQPFGFVHRDLHRSFSACEGRRRDATRYVMRGARIPPTKKIRRQRNFGAFALKRAGSRSPCALGIQLRRMSHD